MGYCCYLHHFISFPLFNVYIMYLNSQHIIQITNNTSMHLHRKSEVLASYANNGPLARHISTSHESHNKKRSRWKTNASSPLAHSVDYHSPEETKAKVNSFLPLFNKLLQRSKPKRSRPPPKNPSEGLIKIQETPDRCIILRRKCQALPAGQSVSRVLSDMRMIRLSQWRKSSRSSMISSYSQCASYVDSNADGTSLEIKDWHSGAKIHRKKPHDLGKANMRVTVEDLVGGESKLRQRCLLKLKR